IRVDQPEPNTLVVWMTGTAVAGSEVHGSSAGITFELEQALEILPTRSGLRPPRIGMVGFVEGTLQVTDPYKHAKYKTCGSAEQSARTACLALGDAPILSIAVRPFAVGPGSPVFVNNREGPVEVVGAPGCYTLQASFGMTVSQGKCMCTRQYAVADFDPAPQLAPSSAHALRAATAVVPNA